MKFIRIVYLAFIIIFGASTVLADSTPGLVKKGNRHFDKKEYTEASDLYSEAQKQRPDDPVILYNLGNVAYKEGRFEEAQKLYKQAAELAGSDTRLESLALFHTGNAAYSHAESLIAANPQSALETYGQGVQSWRDAIKRAKAGGLDDEKIIENAGYNMEVARMKIKKLREIMPPEKKMSGPQSQDLKKKLEDLAKSERNVAKDSRAGEQNKEENQQNRQSAEQQQKQNIEETRDLLNKLKQESQKADKGDQQAEARKSVEENLKNSLENQESAQHNLEQNRLGEAAEKADEAAQNIEDAIGALSQESEDREASQGEQQQMAQEKESNIDKEASDKMDGEEARREIERLREKARNDQEELQRQRGIRVRSIRRKPVDKDW